MWPELATDTLAHLGLAASALLLALAAGVPLGLAAAGYGPVRGIVLAGAAMGRTLPSIAVLMLLLPLLGVGTALAVVALALLAIPPIVINLDLGIRSVPVAVLDAAAGMGMTRFERFARATVPLALPVAFAGVRTAATEAIASASLATFIGAGGLGNFIVRGLQTGDSAYLFTGAAAVALLALAVELSLGGIGRLMESRV